MSFGSNPQDKGKKFDTYGSGSGLYVTREMKQALAYRVLTPSWKLILQEGIYSYLRASGYDKKDISEVGFAFTHTCCEEDVDERTFQEGRTELCKLGWFKVAPELKSNKPGSPNRFLPSTVWRDVKKSEAWTDADLKTGFVPKTEAEEKRRNKMVQRRAWLKGRLDKLEKRCTRKENRRKRGLKQLQKLREEGPKKQKERGHSRGTP